MVENKFGNVLVYKPHNLRTVRQEMDTVEALNQILKKG
jgi:hypothetical protein